MSIRRTISYEQYTQLSSAERRSHASKKALESNVYGYDYVFFVRVLTAPYPVNQYSMKAYANSMKNNSVEKDRLQSFGFKGRIEDSRERPSPHRCLPDPNNPGLFKDECQRQLAILMHTNFVASNGWQGDTPAVNDVVKVTLEPGDYSFNLQRAHFDTIHIEEQFSTKVKTGSGGTSSSGAFSKQKANNTVGQVVNRQGSKTIQPLSVEDMEDDQIPGAILPVGTKITSPFGWRKDPWTGKQKWHAGVDFNGGRRSAARYRKENTVAAWKVATEPNDQEPCYAILGGEVIEAYINLKKRPCPPKSEGAAAKKAANCNGYGSKVTIKSKVKDKGGKDRVVYHVYAHCEKLFVKKGDQVIQGQKIGNIGAQGGSTGPHLHFEARVDGNSYKKNVKDPLIVFGWGPRDNGKKPKIAALKESDAPQDNNNEGNPDG